MVHAQFSSDVDVSNAAVWIVPELAAFVSSDLKSFSLLHAGNSYELTLFVSLPRGFTDAGLQGTVHIRDKKTNTTISRPLPISITAVPPAQTAAATPTTVALPSDDRISTDAQLHFAAAFVNDEVDILFASSVNNKTIDDVAHGIIGAFLGSVPAVRYYQILVHPTDFGGLLGIIITLEQNPAVSVANFHFIYKTLVFPADPGADLSYDPAQNDLPHAWDITTGVRALPDGSPLKIGVIDTVFDYNHSDLAANIAFHTQNNTLLSASQHGTRVASIIGAVANNNIGIAGVMWNSSLYLYSAGTATGGNDGALLVQRVSEAIGDQMRVVNWSIGGGCSACTAQDLAALALYQKQYSQLFGVAGKNVLWVMAAGNDGAPLKNSTAQLANTLSNVVAASAVDSSGTLASFSDYGAGVIAAPGVEVYSDIPGGEYDNGTFCVLAICFDTGLASGTSFAAPHVAGVAGLMLSVNHGLTPAQLKTIIHSAATHTGNLDPNNNEVLLLDAFRGVQQAQAMLTGKVYAYATESVGGSPGVWSYTLDPTTGTLTPVINPLTSTPGFTSPADPGPVSIAADPAGKFIYVANLGISSFNGNISGYAVDPATGVLTPVPGTPFSAGVGPISVAVHPTGKFLFAANAVSGDVSSYLINSSTGSLISVLGSPFPAGEGSLESVAVDPTGKFLYVANGSSSNGKISAFTIDQITGVLTLVAGSPFTAGSFSLFNSLSVDPTGRFIYKTNLSGSISAFAINLATGSLTPIVGSPFSGELDASAVAVDQAGKFLYVANASTSSGSVSVFAINPTTGVLTPVIGSPFPPVVGAFSVAVDPAGKFVYAITGSFGVFSIIGFSVGQSGALTPLVGSPFPSSSPVAIAISEKSP